MSLSPSRSHEKEIDDVPDKVTKLTEASSIEIGSQENHPLEIQDCTNPDRCVKKCMANFPTALRKEIYAQYWEKSEIRNGKGVRI